MSSSDKLLLGEMLDLVEQLSPRGLKVLQHKLRLVSKVKKSTQETVSSRTRSAQTKPIWQKIDEMANKLPDKYFKSLPADGAANHDKYLYGK